MHIIIKASHKPIFDQRFKAEFVSLQMLIAYKVGP